LKFSQAHPSSWTRTLHGLLGLVLMCVLTLGLAQLDSSTRVTAVKLEPSKPPAAAHGTWPQNLKLSWATNYAKPLTAACLCNSRSIFN